MTPTHLSVLGTATGGIRVRTSAGWSDWRSIATCPGGRETGRSAAFVSLAHDTVEYELRLSQDAVVSELNTLDGPAAGRLGPPRLRHRSRGGGERAGPPPSPVIAHTPRSPQEFAQIVRGPTPEC